MKSRMGLTSRQDIENKAQKSNGHLFLWTNVEYCCKVRDCLVEWHNGYDLFVVEIFIGSVTLILETHIKDGWHHGRDICWSWRSWGESAIGLVLSGCWTANEGSACIVCTILCCFDMGVHILGSRLFCNGAAYKLGVYCLQIYDAADFKASIR